MKIIWKTLLTWEDNNKVCNFKDQILIGVYNIDKTLNNNNNINNNNKKCLQH